MPEYRLTARPDAPGYYDGVAYFVGGVGEGGPVGAVRGVYGRGRAREEVARGVLCFLEGRREGREREKSGEGEGVGESGLSSSG